MTEKTPIWRQIQHSLWIVNLTENLGPHRGRPARRDVVLFAVLAVTTAIGLVVYNRVAVPSTARGESG